MTHKKNMISTTSADGVRPYVPGRGTVKTTLPYWPAAQRPLRYDLAMQFAAARAAAAQPRLLAITSNVVTWRERIFSDRSVS